MNVTITVRCTRPEWTGGLAEHQVHNQSGPWTTAEAIAWVARIESEGDWVYHSHRNAD